MFRTANPAMRNDPFGPAQTWDDVSRSGRAVPGVDLDATNESAAAAKPKRAAGVMTMGGTVQKSLFLLTVCAATAVWAWNMILPFDPETGAHLAQFKMNPWLPIGGGLVVGLVLALVTIFKPRLAPVTSPFYAAAEGFLLGGLSAFYAAAFALPKGGDDGLGGMMHANYAIILQAILITLGITGAMLAVYGTGLVKPGKKFYAGVMAATGGVMIVYLISWIGMLVGFRVPFIHESGLLGIGFSLLVIGIASMNLILDFDIIARGVQNRAPKYMEWYGGFTLLVTLVWLYIEVLRLLGKLQSRD